jgi:ribonuclease BN (tRNA processing enzyme)
MFRSIISALFILMAGSVAQAQSCVGNPVAVQILGSGGPLATERASTSYVLWVGSEAKVLIDMGGGALFRYRQSKANMKDLLFFGISHLHPDHVSDLPAFFWLSDRARKEPLPIVGPSGNESAPSLPTFLSRLFDERNGAFQVLAPTVGGAAQDNIVGGVRLDVRVVDAAKSVPSQIFDENGTTVTALGIPHDHFPTLAFRVQTRDASIVFSSDQDGTDPNFVNFAKGATVLIMHLQMGAATTHPYHASPAVVGRIANDADIGRLIVSHIGEMDLDAAIAELKKFYTGPLTIGADLQCTQLR